MDYLTTHTSPSPILRGFAPSFVNYKKGWTRLVAASDKVYQLLAHGRWFSPASSTTKTGCHDIAESGIKHNKSNQIQSNFLPKKGTKFTNRSVDNHYYIVRLKSYYHIIAATIILMALITSATIILMNDPHYFSYLKYSETCLNRILNKPKSFINET